MANRSGKIISTLALIGVLAVLLFYAGLFRPPNRPNLILIVVDTLRADRLSCYGYDRIRTPNIDALAESGVRFENATAHVPITLPSMATIMTSTLPPTNGVHNNENYYLDDAALTLAEILREEDYRTGAVIGAMVLDSISGISQGFQYYDDKFEDVYTGYQEYAGRIGQQLNHTQRRAESVTNRAIGMVDRLTGGEMEDEPFFLFLHYFDPHSPYDPPPPFSRIEPSVFIGSQEYLNQLYDGEVAYLDLHIGRLIRGLRERGLLSNTLIVLTSDHGEGLGGHGEMTHAYYVYEGTLRVPLIYSMPGRLPEGMVSQDLARLTDVLPTILDLLGLESRHHPEIEGTSLYPFSERNGVDFSYFESAMTYLMFDWSGLRGLRSREWKYIDAPREELYHLASDPGESHNIIEEMPDIADSLKVELERIVADLEIHPGLEREQVSATEDREFGEGYREKLRALGYIGEPRKEVSTYEEMFDPLLPDPKDRLETYHAFLESYKYLQIGIAYIKEDSLDMAVDFLRKSAELAPQNATTHFFLGVAYNRSREIDKAKSALDAALRIDPYFADANAVLAGIFLSRGDSTAATDALERIFRAEKLTSNSLMKARRLWERLGMTGKAVEAMKVALEVDTNSLPARLYLAEHSLIEGDLEDAYRYLEPLEGNIRDEDSLSTRIHYGLGRCYYHRGDLVKAESHFRRVVAIDSSSADAYNQLGLIYDDLKEYEMAIVNYRRALELAPDFVEVHSNLGVTYFNMGRYLESMEEFETYLPHAENIEEEERLNRLIGQIRQMEGNGE
jgi:arylsulfatase A-like enzyme/Tfp pilus assembly protein PilF